MNRRRLLSTTVAGTVVMTIGACGRADPNNPKTSRSTNRRLELLLDEPATIDPALVAQSHEATVVDALFEPLVRITEGGQTHPASAVSWQITDNGRAYQFNLNAGNQWTSGEADSADDFVWSWIRNLNPELGSTFNYLLFPISGAEEFANGIGDRNSIRIHAPDTTTLRVHLHEPSPDLLARTATSTFLPLPRSEIEGMGTHWTDPSNIRTNGAYTLAQWDRGLGMTLHRNSTYQGQAATFRDVVIRYPSTTTSRSTEFRTGTSHAAEISRSDYAEARTSELLRPRLRLFERAGGWFLVINTRKEPWSSPLVRRALSIALDRPALVAAVFDQPTLPADRLIPSSILANAPQSVLDIPHAQALLTEAGFDGGQGLPTLRLTYHRTDQWDRLAVELARQWGEALNLRVEPDVREWRDFLSFSDNPGDFDAYRAGWTSEYRHPENWYNDLWHSNVDFFRSGWSSSVFDTHLAAARTAPTDEATRAAYRAADNILESEVPAIPIARHASAFLLKSNVTAFAVDPISGAIDLSKVELGD